MAHLVMGPDFSDSDDDILLDFDYSYSKPKYRNLLSLINQPTEDVEMKSSHFFEAISRNNLDLIKDYLTKGFEINSIKSDGWSPLMLSVSNGYVQLTQILLEYGVDVNGDRDGTTALMVACKSSSDVVPYDKSFEIIKLLIEHGADPKTIDRKRMTSLMLAATNGNLAAVKYLLPLSDKNAVDNQRWSALTWAVGNNQVEVAKYLMNEGIDLTLTDVRGQTPFDIARDNDLEEMIALFPEVEAEIYTDLITHRIPFEEHFQNLKKGEIPRFFNEVCEILIASKCESAIPQIYDNNVHLKQFLSVSDAELIKMGILMPYQRHRILAALHRFHKEPFHQESLHICLNNDDYTNVDVAIILMTAIQQIIAMESSLSFIQKNKMCVLNSAEAKSIRHRIKSIQLNLKKCQLVNNKLKQETKQWDKRIAPVDLITEKSIRSKFPWKKLTFAVGLFGIVLMHKLKKTLSCLF